jgi:hypothetical protein
VKRALRLVATSAFVLALPSLHGATNPQPASGDTKLHLEACIKWSEKNGRFGFTNECRAAVAILFIELNGPHRYDRVIRPDERFDIDLPGKTINETGWLFTACPAGYGPNVPFSAENRTRIVKSQYECVRK